MRDRIQISTVCLFICVPGYFAGAWHLYETGGEGPLFGVVLALYALALYVTLGVLAIDFKRWAWRACNGAFLIHLVLCLLAAPQALQRGWVGILASLLWIALGGIGLWANLRPGSRAVLLPARQGAS